MITEKRLALLVGKWQSRLAILGVSHWRVESLTITDTMPNNASSNASVWISQDYDSIHLYFNSEYLEKATPASLDETIIHEWMHVAMRDLDSCSAAVASWMPAQTYEDFAEALDHEREGFVDRLARQLYAFHAAKD